VLYTFASWAAQGQRLFGPDSTDWKFKCPVCNRSRTPLDALASGGKLEDAMQVCAGIGTGLGACNYVTRLNDGLCDTVGEATCLPFDAIWCSKCGNLSTQAAGFCMPCMIGVPSDPA